MRVKAELYELIQTLSGTEKRYFRLNVNRHKKDSASHSWELYEVLLGMEEYNEELLRSRLKDASFLPQLAFYKNYLKKLILRSLREYHRESSIDMELREQLDHIEILHAKGMIQWCQRLLKRLYKQALQLEALNTLLEVNRWEMQLIRNSQASGFRERLEHLSQEKEGLLEKLTVEGKIRALHDQYLGIVTQNIHLRNDSDREWLTHLDSNPLLVSSETMPTRNSMIYFLYCKIYSQQLKGNYPEVVGWYRRLDQLFEDHPEMVHRFEERYLKFLLGYLDACLEANEYQLFQTMLPRINGFKATSPSQEAMVFKASVHLQIRYRLNANDFNQGKELHQMVNNGFTLHDKYISKPTRLSFAYNLLVIAFLGQNLSQALIWSNYILNMPEWEMRQDIRIAARVFHLLLHYQLENYDLVSFLQRSTKRYLIDKDLSVHFEELVLQYMRQIADLPLSQHQGILNEMKEQLIQLPLESTSVLGHREVILWLEQLNLNR